MEDVRMQSEMVGRWLAGRLTEPALAWLDEQAQRIRCDTGLRSLTTAIGLAPRRLGKADLALSEEEAAAARQLCAGLDTSGWSVDGAARIYFVLASYTGDDAAFASRLNTIVATAEISELIALLRGLPLLPAAPHLVAFAAEGVRSAMLPVFEAVAHRNPFPFAHFSEEQWNQMVVKTLFIGSTLAPVYGLDERRNADLAVILVDYAHERWAAGRSVSPQLWRCVGPFANEAGLAALQHVRATGSQEERLAATQALSEHAEALAQASSRNKKCNA